MKRWPNCECPEGFYIEQATKKRKRVNFPHDCDYIAIRNSMIPEALTLALKYYGIDDARWVSSYMGHMNNLTQERLAQLIDNIK